MISRNILNLLPAIAIVLCILPMRSFADGISNTSIAQEIRRGLEKAKSKVSDASVVYTLTKVDGDKTSHYRINFWVRENTYFRVDAQEVVNESPTGKVERIIARPEGFAKVVADSLEDPGVVVNFGTFDEGMDQIAGHYFFAAYSRYAAVLPVTDILKGFDRNEAEWVTKVSSNENANLRLDFEYTGEAVSTNGWIILNPETFVHTESHLTNVNPNGSDFEIIVDKQYRNMLPVPEKIIEKWTCNDGSVRKWQYDLVTVSAQQPSIEVFNIANQTVSAKNLHDTWLRRLVFIAAGIVFLLLYFFLKRRRRSAR